MTAKGVLQLEYLLDGEHKDWSDDGDSDAGEDPQGGASDELVGVLEGFLEGGDGEESYILLLLSIAHQIHIHQLLDLWATHSTRL